MPEFMYMKNEVRDRYEACEVLEESERKEESLKKVIRAETCKRENGILSSNLTETQNKSISNKLLDVTMENMHCKIIAFARFNLYFAIRYFHLQCFIFV